MRALEDGEEECTPLKTEKNRSLNSARDDEFVDDREVAMDHADVATRIPRFVSRGRSARRGLSEAANVEDGDDDTF